MVGDRRLWLRTDYGNFYVSKSFFDSKNGRRIIWGLTHETYSSSEDVAKGWAGIHVRKSAPHWLYPLHTKILN